MAQKRKNKFSEENFMAGFSVGIAVGAAGMFLFGTDEGNKLRKELKEHWQEAVHDLLAEGVIENAEQDMWELFKEILDKASEDVEDHIPKKTKKTKSSANRTKSKKNLFKGT